MFKCPVAGAAERAARRVEYLRAKDAARRERDDYRKLYGTAAWRQLRFWKLCQTPICEEKERDGTPCREAATVVHHDQDHKGNPALFFDRANLVSLCKKHHDAITAKRVNEQKNR